MVLFVFLLSVLLVNNFSILNAAHTHAFVVKKLIKCGFNPTSVLDVGGNKGDWTKGMRELFPTAKFFIIEGDAQHTAELKAIGQPFEIALVSDVEKNVTFYAVQFPGGTGNSIFEENGAVEKVKVSRTAYTIDSIVLKNKVPTVDFIKLDIQGSELNALKGAKETVKGVDVIITEVSIQNYNNGAPSFFDMQVYMDSIGFALYNILENMYDGHHQMIQMDVVFVRKTSKYWSQECTTYPSRWPAASKSARKDRE